MRERERERVSEHGIFVVFKALAPIRFFSYVAFFLNVTAENIQLFSSFITLMCWFFAFNGWKIHLIYNCVNEISKNIFKTLGLNFHFWRLLKSVCAKGGNRQNLHENQIQAIRTEKNSNFVFSFRFETLGFDISFFIPVMSENCPNFVHCPPNCTLHVSRVQRLKPCHITGKRYSSWESIKMPE